MIIVLLGPPGVGKGTIGGLLEKKLGIPRLSTGDVFREEIRNKTAVGIEADSYISKGNLVPDELTVNLVSDRIRGYKGNVLLDGIPRTVRQAELLEQNGIHVDKVLALEANDDLLVKRLSTRLQCPKGHVYNITMNPPKREGICDVCNTQLYRRDDDDAPERVRMRLTVYRKETAPLLEHYKRILVSVDATRTPEEICAEALRKLGL